MLRYDNQTIAFFGIYIISLVFWITLVIHREVSGSDNEFMRHNTLSVCNNWCIGHFLQYLALGFFAPRYFKEALFIGIFFEILEIPLGLYLSKYIDSKIIEDTITNTSGLLIGLALSYLLAH